MQSREPISAPPLLKLSRKRWSNAPDQSLKDLPIPAGLDTAFAETAEGRHYHCGSHTPH
jgi:hypothetical protein